MSDSHLYTRLLLPKRHGYPLFHPQPFDDLPLQSRRVGTEIGDLGVVTSDGSFDVIFNICRAADDPLNRFGVPAGFEQLILDAEDVAFRAQYHRPGSDISNTRINKRRLDLDATIDANVFLPLGAGAVAEISASSRQAAMLLLPDGASRWDVRRLKRFRDYALKHAQSWYEFVNGSLERMVESGDLYLVTGFDKSTSWSLAAVENESQDCKISLKLKAAQVGSAGTSCAWEWESTSCFADSGPRGQPDDVSGAANQTVFLRGFKIAVRPSSWRRTAKVVSVTESKPSDILAKSGFVPFSRPSAGGTTFFRNSSGQNRGDPSDEEDSVQFFPEIPKLYHPSSVINDHIFACCPDAEVAVVHDDDWTSVLSVDDDGAFPDDEELLDRISRKYHCAQTPFGGVTLVESVGLESLVASSAPLRLVDPEPSSPPTSGASTDVLTPHGGAREFGYALGRPAADRTNKEDSQIAAEGAKKQDSGSKGGGDRMGDGGHNRNPLLAGGSTGPTRPRPPMSMPLKATISPAPTPPPKDTDFASFAVLHEATQLPTVPSPKLPSSPTFNRSSSLASEFTPFHALPGGRRLPGFVRRPNPYDVSPRPSASAANPWSAEVAAKDLPGPVFLFQGVVEEREERGVRTLKAYRAFASSSSGQYDVESGTTGRRTFKRPRIGGWYSSARSGGFEGRDGQAGSHVEDLGGMGMSMDSADEDGMRRLNPSSASFPRFSPSNHFNQCKERAGVANNGLNASNAKGYDQHILVPYASPGGDPSLHPASDTTPGRSSSFLSKFNPFPPSSNLHASPSDRGSQIRAQHRRYRSVSPYDASSRPSASDAWSAEVAAEHSSLPTFHGQYHYSPGLSDGAPSLSASEHPRQHSDDPLVIRRVASEATIRASKQRRKNSTLGGALVCHICGKDFTAKHNLKNHMNSHNNVKTFACDDCGQAFGTARVLKRHRRKCLKALSRASERDFGQY